MPIASRRSRSASAAMPMNSLPRWLISITDMPLPCQSSTSSPARASTSAGSMAGTALALAQSDQRHALGGAPLLADLRHGGADEHAAGGDQHHFLVAVHQH